MVGLAILTAASATTIVATALLPTFMVYASAKSLNWAGSALGCAVSWLMLLFVTVFLGLELNDQQASYFADDGSFDQLARWGGWIGFVLFVVSLGNVVLRRHLQAKKDC